MCNDCVINQLLLIIYFTLLLIAWYTKHSIRWKKIDWKCIESLTVIWFEALKIWNGQTKLGWWVKILYYLDKLISILAIFRSPSVSCHQLAYSFCFLYLSPTLGLKLNIPANKSPWGSCFFFFRFIWNTDIL